MKHTVTEHKLKSGARGLVINVPDSNVVNLVVRFASGYQFADQRTFEVPHVMEHLLATVTKKYAGPNAFNIEVGKNGAYMNANTSSDFNGYIYECADFELDRILDLVEEQLVRPLFAAEPLAAELGNVREELTRNTTQHPSVCSVRLNEQTFPGQSLDYEARLAQLDNITVEAVTDHHRKTHTAANACFVVAGSFDDGGQAVVARLNQMFDQLEPGKRLSLSQELGRDLAHPVVTSRDIKQLYYRYELFCGELTQPERHAMTLMRLVLLGGMASRIYGEARRRGLAYHVGGGGQAGKGHSSFGFAGYVTPVNATALFELITREMRATLDGQLTPIELEAARNLGIGSTKRSYQTSGDMLGWYLGPYFHEDRILRFDDYLDELLQIKPADLTAVAHKIVQPRRRGISLLGDLDEAQAISYQQLLDPILT